MRENDFQEQFLAELRKKGEQVSVFLVSGIQLRGEIAGFDNFVLLLKRDDVLQMVYKHAISTVLCQHDAV